MCNGNKKCKPCALAQIGKTMAKKTRRSKGGLQTVGAITTGLLAGAFAVPRLMNAVDPAQKVNPKLVSGIGTAAAYFFGTKTSGFGQTALYGLSAGLALNLIASVAGIGYVDSPTYDVNRVAGAGSNYYGTTGANPGAI